MGTLTVPFAPWPTHGYEATRAVCGEDQSAVMARTEDFATSNRLMYRSKGRLLRLSNGRVALPAFVLQNELFESDIATRATKHDSRLISQSCGTSRASARLSGLACLRLSDWASLRSAWPISPSVVDVVLRDPPRQQQPQQDYGWPGETVSGPAARRPVTDAKKSCGGDLGETKTGEGIAVVRRGHIAVVRRDHQVLSMCYRRDAGEPQPDRRRLPPR
jgi:hypothetical protein